MKKGRSITVPWEVIKSGGLKGRADVAQPGTTAQSKRCPPVEQLVLWSALQLARRRRYAEAESALAPLRSSASDVRAQACDLLARIRVRQWRFSDADALWAKAGALAPDSCCYRRARQVLPLVPVLWRALVAAAFAILVVLAFAAGLNASRRGDHTGDATKPQAPPERTASPNTEGGNT